MHKLDISGPKCQTNVCHCIEIEIRSTPVAYQVWKNVQLAKSTRLTT